VLKTVNVVIMQNVSLETDNVVVKKNVFILFLFIYIFYQIRGLIAYY
jgi:hypothetical protein